VIEEQIFPDRLARRATVRMEQQEIPEEVGSAARKDAMDEDRIAWGDLHEFSVSHPEVWIDEDLPSVGDRRHGGTQTATTTRLP
jgi:hypothetical protein